VLADLRLNQIDYFLVWGDSQQFTFTGELPEIFARSGGRPADLSCRAADWALREIRKDII